MGIAKSQMSKDADGGLFNLSLAHKIVVGYLILIALIVTVSSYALHKMSLIGMEIEELAKIDIPLIQSIGSVETLLVEQAIILERLLRVADEQLGFSEDVKNVQGVEDAMDFQDSLDVLDTLDVLDRISNAADKLSAEFRELSRKVEVELRGVEKQTKANVRSALFKEETEEFDHVLESLDRIRTEHAEYERLAFTILDLVGRSQWDFREQQDLIQIIAKEQLQLDREIESLIVDVGEFAKSSALSAEENEKSATIGISVILAAALIVAIAVMIQTARIANAMQISITKEIWIKDNIAGLNEQLRGEKSLLQLSEDVLRFLAGVLNAQVGAFYLWGIKGKQTLTLQSSYAYKKRKNLSNEFEIGEGLIGQCAIEKKPILLTEVPADYIKVTSGVGEAVPTNIAVYPILYEGEVKGVFELGSLSEFDEENSIILDQASSNIGIAVNAAESRQALAQSLEAAQKQSEELQSQQEELKISNESLMEQTNRLKTSEEELKQQSEELQVSNEELEEKQEYLRRQNLIVEEAKKEVEIQAQELTLANKYKSEFLANMSHELRTPLNSLLLLSKGLANNMEGNLTEGQVEDALVIYDGGNDLLALISDIMDLSKVEAGMLSVHSEELRLETLKRNLLRLFDPVARDNELLFEIDIDKTLPEVIISDSQRVEQILKNLLSNAMKFTDKGSVRLKISTVDKAIIFKNIALNRENVIAFSVIDSGVGVPPQKQQAIFEAFQQQDGSTSRRYGGTGLGLTISRELARLLGGEIQLQSIENEGSTFTLYLPRNQKIESTDTKSVRYLSPGRAKEVAIERLDQVPSRLSESDQSINRDSPMQTAELFIPDDRKDIVAGDRVLLIIDDDRKFAKILRDQGRKNNYKCIVAGDGRNGIYLAMKYIPIGILLDISLPDIDGYKVLEQLKFRKRTRDIPVQIISASEDDKERSLTQGAIGYQVKPVEQEQLIGIFEKMAGIVGDDIKTLLIVEDDSSNQHVIDGLFNDRGITITCVATGKEACDLILQGHYDCVVLDLGLPDMSGFDVLEYVNENKSHMLPPIIIFTGKELSDEENAELEKYAASTVVKSAGSAERLLDETELFLHTIEENEKDTRSGALSMLHDDGAMLRNRKILLVDDDMRNSYALSKRLIEIGFNVEMAKHGKEAIERLESDSDYELVLMDIMMPVMDGYEATRLIRKMDQYKDIPIIALTAKAMLEDRDKCLQAGASEYLVKPIDFEKLLSIMRIWLFKHS